jgi:hypothetical protein
LQIHPQRGSPPISEDMDKKEEKRRRR